MAHVTQHIVEDSWLARILQRPVYRLEIGPRFWGDSGGADRARLEELRTQPVFLYAKLPPTDLQGIEFLQRSGFNLVDTNVVLEKPIGPPATADRIA